MNNQQTTPFVVPCCLSDGEVVKLWDWLDKRIPCSLPQWRDKNKIPLVVSVWNDNFNAFTFCAPAHGSKEMLAIRLENLRGCVFFSEKLYVFFKILVDIP